MLHIIRINKSFRGKGTRILKNRVSQPWLPMSFICGNLIKKKKKATWSLRTESKPWEWRAWVAEAKRFQTWMVSCRATLRAPGKDADLCTGTTQAMLAKRSQLSHLLLPTHWTIQARKWFLSSNARWSWSHYLIMSNYMGFRKRKKKSIVKALGEMPTNLPIFH